MATQIDFALDATNKVGHVHEHGNPDAVIVVFPEQAILIHSNEQRARFYIAHESTPNVPLFSFDAEQLRSATATPAESSVEVGSVFNAFGTVKAAFGTPVA